jgi:hypothetical protein
LFFEHIYYDDTDGWTLQDYDAAARPIVEGDINELDEVNMESDIKELDEVSLVAYETEI